MHPLAVGLRPGLPIASTPPKQEKAVSSRQIVAAKLGGSGGERLVHSTALTDRTESGPQAKVAGGPPT